MNNILWFSFVLIMVCASIGCIYAIIIAGIFTYEFVKEWMEGWKNV